MYLAQGRTYSRKVLRDKGCRFEFGFSPSTKPISKCGDYNEIADELRYPGSVQEFNNRASGDRGKHPTQKLVALMEYLIKTYTNEGEIVLDFTMGSGTTGVACKNLKRNFIGIETDEIYFNIAKQRIENSAIIQPDQFLFNPRR